MTTETAKTETLMTSDDDSRSLVRHDSGECWVVEHATGLHSAALHHAEVERLVSGELSLHDVECDCSSLTLEQVTQWGRELAGVGGEEDRVELLEMAGQWERREAHSWSYLVGEQEDVQIEALIESEGRAAVFAALRAGLTAR